MSESYDPPELSILPPLESQDGPIISPEEQSRDRHPTARKYQLKAIPGLPEVELTTEATDPE